ncbi:MAG: hypothetical protein ABI137_01020, partial [Antricoccus sp.]
SSPPPRHNFTSLPRIRSERPAFELHYPHMLERMELEAHAGSKTHEDRVAAMAGASADAVPLEDRERDGHNRPI